MNSFKNGVLFHIEMILETYKPHYKKLNSNQKEDFDRLKRCSELLKQKGVFHSIVTGKSKALILIELIAAMS